MEATATHLSGLDWPELVGLLHLDGRGFLFEANRGGKRKRSWAEISAIQLQASAKPKQVVLVLLTAEGAVTFDVVESGAHLLDALRMVAPQALTEGVTDPAAQKLAGVVDVRFVTTLPSLPGFRTKHALGVVSQLSAASGWTAGVKGGTALERATNALRTRAATLGANAILGLVASTFGAGGGITSAFGGDAVGVLLMGTAAVVEPEEPADGAALAPTL